MTKEPESGIPPTVTAGLSGEAGAGPPHPGYARLLRRIQALAYDGVIFGVTGIGTLVILDALGVESLQVKLLSIASVLVVLDVCLVAFTGGTIGHHLARIRVARTQSAQNIGLPRAIVRSVVKVLLGWASLFFVFATKRHQALHDLASGSVVLVKTHARVDESERLGERGDEFETGNHASWWRRILIGLLYFLLAYTVISTAMLLFVSFDCAQTGHCTDQEYHLILGTWALVALSLIACLFLAWTGRLYGCRRRRQSPDDSST